MIIKRRYTRFIIFAVFLSALIVMSGCQDDLFRGPGFGDDAVKLAIDFTPMSESKIESRGTVTPPGDGMRDINDICIVIFDSEGNFIDIRDITDLCNFIDEKRTGQDASNGNLAGETSTKHTEITLDGLLGGKYHIYAVANMGYYGDNPSTTYDELIKNGIRDMNRDQFRQMRRVWDPDDYRNNSVMAGYFAIADPDRKDGKSKSPSTTSEIDKPVYVGNGVKLHCWLRRLASKVTVNFDAKNLSKSTTIYLRDVKIKDIPYDCALIAPNAVEPSASNDSPKGLMSNEKSSHVIQYCPDFTGETHDNFKNWPKLTSTNYDIDGDPHADTAPALFFYENMQGVAVNPEDYKLPDGNSDGVIDSPTSTDPTDPDYKDRHLAGTYIEVRAYYESFDEGNEGSGDIIYRFMLGKDAIKDYDAERNHHYKLTLVFNGYANDYDWHIEYDYIEPPVTIPNPYYISYGYNESLDLPIKVNGTIIGDVTAEIVRNDWWPSVIWEDEEGNMDYHFDPSRVLTPDDKREMDYKNDKSYDEGNTKLALGFLSLRASHHDAVGIDIAKDPDAEKIELAGIRDAQVKQYFKDLWEGKGGTHGGQEDKKYTNDKGEVVPLYRRTYKIPTALNETVYNTGENAPDASGSYRVVIKEVGSGEKKYTQTTLYLPLYTRQRNIIKISGFTGNNPYDTNQRRARVRYKFKYKDANGIEKNYEETIDIIQASKITNPMGVWRKWNSAKPFQITLMHRDGVNSTSYRPITSHGGGWSAEVEIGKDWILLNNGRQKVYGGMSEISFSYRPSGILTSPDQTRCGIILVRYHNYSCVHRIMVRQGYAPIKINPDGVYWRSFNMIAEGVEATSPLDEGSMFKFGNWKQPIDASENVNDKIPWIEFDHKSFKDHSTDYFKLAGDNNLNADNTRKTSLWSGITSKIGNSFHYSDEGAIVLEDGTNARIFKTEDIAKLRDHEDTRFRYGVLYGDGASETLTAIGEVHGFKGANPNTHSYGMRGCFVYNRKNANQIFLPIGTSGYGHRRGEPNTILNPVPDDKGWSNRPDVGTAVLRYASGRVTFTKLDTEAPYAPLFYDLFRRYGANYWGDGFSSYGTKTLDQNKCALDLNYFTFDFNPIGNEMFKNTTEANQSDACFIRLVQDKK